MDALIGCWHLEYADPALGMDEPAEIEFMRDGQLIYSIDASDKWQIMRLRYRIEGSDLVTDQPSSPKEERTAFFLEGIDKLVLDYGGAKASFVRGDKRAPAV
ncbi:MAG: hypothetical protein K0M66_01670 [Thiobacillus sp.]|nr:hypothetical protein [Thiobacillus sp.]